MGVFGFIVTFIIVWWLVFFATLPFGVRGAAEAGEKLSRGADPGAPVDPKLKTKALAASAIALPIVLIIWACVEFHLLA
jgi:predicted secreted protein